MTNLFGKVAGERKRLWGVIFQSKPKKYAENAIEFPLTSIGPWFHTITVRINNCRRMQSLATNLQQSIVINANAMGSEERIRIPE